MMIDEIHKKLFVWADWARARESGGLGYKASSINLWHHVPGGEVPDYVPDVLDGAALEECDLIEAIVTGRLGRVSKLSRHVIRAFYVVGGTAVQHARDFKVHRDTFYSYLHNAHVEVGRVMENKRVPVVARGVGVRIRKANVYEACNDKNC